MAVQSGLFCSAAFGPNLAVKPKIVRVIRICCPRTARYKKVQNMKTTRGRIIISSILLCVGISAVLGAPSGSPQEKATSLRGLPALDPSAGFGRTGAEAPSARYKVAVDLSEMTNDLGWVEKPETMSTTPLQVGVARPTQIVSSERAQRFQNADGTELLVFAIKSPGAEAMRLQFTQFNIPAGDEVYVRSASGKGGVAGPYRSDGDRKDETFWSGSVDGDTAIVEYHIRSKAGVFVVSSVAHIFEEIADTPTVLGCHVDASCSSVGPKDAVARIVFISGGNVYVCTGTL